MFKKRRPIEHNKNKPNICIVSFPMSSFWVIEVFLEDLINIMKPITNKVYLISNIHNSSIMDLNTVFFDTKMNLDSSKYLNNSLIKIYKIIMSILIQLIISFYLISIFKNIKLIIFYVGGINLILPMIVSRLFRKKIIYFALGRGPSNCGIIFDIANSSIINSFFKNLVDLFYSLLYEMPHKIVVESESEIDFLGFNKYHTKVDTRGARFIDTQKFYIMNNFKERKKIIGFLSRLNNEKGVFNFLESFQILNNCYNNGFIFEIYGEGPLKDKLNEYILKNRLNDCIKLRGLVNSHEMIPSILNSFKLLVLPSYVEGLPTIILEAMACGTPVLATKVGSIPKVIKDGKTGFLMENNSPECIAFNINRALCDETLNEIIFNAHKLINDDYSYERAIERYNHILSDL